MKKLLIILMVLTSLASQAQEESTNSFGFVTGIGYANIMRASQEGSPSLELEKNFELGATFYRQLGERLKLETGLFYHYNQLVQKSMFMPDVPQAHSTILPYLPAGLPALLFFRSFFITGGALLDVDISNSLGRSSSNSLSNQSGLGADLGIGGELAVYPDFYVQLNPYLNLHGGLTIKGDDHPERILDSGIKIGIQIR